MQRFIYPILFVTLAAAVSLAPCLSVAQDAPNSKQSQESDTPIAAQPAQVKRPRKAAQEPPLPMTPEREAAALDFVKSHHAELVALLDQLKAKDRQQYDVVIRDLFRTSERLATMQVNDFPRYEIALRAWKLKSRIQVLAARASLDDDPTILAELRAALDEQAEVRKHQLQYEHDLLAERLERAESALAHFQRDRSQQVDRQYELLLKQIEKSRKDMKLRLTPKTGKARLPKRADEQSVDAPKE
jgi:hypothetical protein